MTFEEFQATGRSVDNVNDYEADIDGDPAGRIYTDESGNDWWVIDSSNEPKAPCKWWTMMFNEQTSGNNLTEIEQWLWERVKEI